MSVSLSDSAKVITKNAIAEYVKKYCELYLRTIYRNNTVIDFRSDLQAVISDININIDAYTNFFTNLRIITAVPEIPLMDFPQGRLLQFSINPAIYTISKQYGSGCAAGCGLHSLLNLFASMNVLRESIVSVLPDLSNLLNQIASGQMLNYNELLFVKAMQESFMESLNNELCTTENDVMDTLGVFANMIAPCVNSEIVQFHLRTKDIRFKEVDLEKRVIVQNSFNTHFNFCDLMCYLNRYTPNSIVSNDIAENKQTIIERGLINMCKLTNERYSIQEIEKAKKEMIVYNIFYKKPLYVIFDIATMVSYFNANSSPMLSFNVSGLKYKLVSVVEHRGLHYVNVFIRDGRGYVYDDLSLDVKVIDIGNINWSEVSVFCFMRNDGEWGTQTTPLTLFQMKENLVRMQELNKPRDSTSEEEYEEEIEEEEFQENDGVRDDSEEISIDPAVIDEIIENPIDYAVEDYSEEESDMSTEDESDESVEEEEDDEDVGYVPYNADDAETSENDYISECSDIDDFEEEEDE